jgi:hypothetical protein
MALGLSSRSLMPPDLQSILTRINDLHPSFWRDPSFWIAQIIGVAGLIASIMAFLEARKAFHEARSAKEAATAAGRTVKIQTVTIELTEIAQKLDRIQPDVVFNEARDLLSEIQRRLRRLVAPFATDPELEEAIGAVLQALQAAQTSLKAVRPSDPTTEAPNSVYYGTQDAFDTINNCVADLLGLFEKQTLDFGDDDAER